MSATPRLLTIDEAADLLRTSPNALLRRCRSGDIRASKPFGAWLIPADAIDELLVEKSNARRPEELGA